MHGLIHPVADPGLLVDGPAEGRLGLRLVAEQRQHRGDHALRQPGGAQVAHGRGEVPGARVGVQRGWEAALDPAQRALVAAQQGLAGGVPGRIDEGEGLP
ncbi:MAG: hypothetical protein ACK559_25445, partial [bacterium]